MRIIIFISLLAFSFNSMAQGLDKKGLKEISDFAKDVCDQISAEGKITRSKIELKLNGNVTGLAKALGLKAGADGLYTRDNEEYKGVPYDQLSEQMSDSRSCKRELSIILIKERSAQKKIEWEESHFFSIYDVKQTAAYRQAISTSSCNVGCFRLEKPSNSSIPPSKDNPLYASAKNCNSDIRVLIKYDTCGAVKKNTGLFQGSKDCRTSRFVTEETKHLPRCTSADKKNSNAVKFISGYEETEGRYFADEWILAGDKLPISPVGKCSLNLAVLSCRVHSNNSVTTYEPRLVGSNKFVLSKTVR